MAASDAGDDGRPSLHAVRSQWDSKIKGSRAEQLTMLREGLASYVVFVITVATVRSTKESLPVLGGAPPPVEDDTEILRESFDFLHQICTTDSVPEGREYVANSGAVVALLEATLHHLVRHADDNATVASAINLLVVLIKKDESCALALVRGGLSLAARVGPSATAKTKDVSCPTCCSPSSFLRSDPPPRSREPPPLKM